jgi:hypothetical protein
MIAMSRWLEAGHAAFSSRTARKELVNRVSKTIIPPRNVNLEGISPKTR